jgi:DtxR family Mn-dependent transcriptional regulator
MRALYHRDGFKKYSGEGATSMDGNAFETSIRSQEIMETLWRSIEEEGQPGVSCSILNCSEEDEDLKDLRRRGWVTVREGRVYLEELGFAEAKAAVRRHRLAERLLADLLDMGGKLREESACQFEHLLHRGIDEKICTLLGHPRSCPHGRPIPPGSCCADKVRNDLQVVSPLSELAEGQGGTVSYLQTEDPAIMQKLMSMGVLPGSPIQLTQCSPSFIFKMGYSQFAIDTDLARCILIRLENGITGQRGLQRPKRRRWSKQPS